MSNVKLFEQAFNEGREAARIIESGEPEYRFIRGKGWLVTREYYPFKELIVGNWKIKFVIREPRIGDLYFKEYGKAPLESLLTAISKSDWWIQTIRDAASIEVLKVNIPCWDGRENVGKGQTIVVMEFEHGY